MIARGQLGAVVAPDVLWRPAPGEHQALERGDGSVGVDRPPALDRVRLAGELVNDVQQLEDPTVGGLIELDVERPDLIGALDEEPLDEEPLGGNRRRAAGAFCAA